MAGIYLHIPFCRQKCHYCNFFSVASRKHLPVFHQVLCQEMEWQKAYLEGEIIHTIYLGGGTPSMLEQSALKAIFDQIDNCFQVAADCEITLEANPEDLTATYLEQLKSTKVNRLSIGVQSFADADLRYMNRNHTGQGALAAIERAREAGFSNLTIDLIFGVPTASDAVWKANLETFFGLELPHLSAYALTVEPRTALHHLIAWGKSTPVEEAQSVRQFEYLMEAMKAHGYRQYEISNYCLPGAESKHNSAYWKGVSYLGLGPSAHSFNGRSRQWNTSHIQAYIEGVHTGNLAFESEELSCNDRFNETVMTGLRADWGVDLDAIRQVYGQSYVVYLQELMVPFVADGTIRLQGDVMRLTQKGKLLADGIASALFRV